MKRKLWFILALCMMAVFSPKSLFAEGTSSQVAVTEVTAKKSAEQAFLQITNHEVTKYSIRPLQHTDARWRFLVEGTKEFARPGYHWIVEVDKASGATSVQSGE